MECSEALEKMDRFLSFLAKRGRKNTTIVTYKSYIKKAIEMLNESSMHCDPERIGEEEIMLFLDDPSLRNTSKKCYITVIKAWTEFYGNYTIKDMRLLWNDDVCETVRWIDLGGYDKLMRAVRNDTEKMILILGARCGLRRHEMVTLRESDCRNGRIYVRGKGHGSEGKIREVPISAEVQKEIDDYIRKKRKAGVKTESLLVKEYNGKIGPISDAYVYHHIRELGEITGIDLTPHSLRRLFATTAIECADIHIVQTLMGHTSITMTERYIRRNQSELAAAMESISGRF